MPRSTPAAPPSLSTALGAAVALGAAQALWSLFQWAQLWVVRAGGEAICGLGGTGNCAAVWSSPFARSIEDTTLLPLAGWGLAWSLAALGFPLWALVRQARADDPSLPWAAAQASAVAGAAGVCVLAAASAWIGVLCTTCAISYALILSYAAVCLLPRPPRRAPPRARGVALAAAGVLAAFLGLTIGSAFFGTTQPGDAPAPAPGTEAPQTLEQLVAPLAPVQRERLGAAVDAWASGPAPARRPTRARLGSAGAPVILTEFSDVLCGHCAGLHRTLATLRQALPAGLFAIESRQFPLDVACNPGVTGHSDAASVRCLAARVRICAEDRPEAAFELSGQLFREQGTLTAMRIYELAAPVASREELERCVGRPETEAKLQDDIEWAVEHEIPGTPLVLINGRRAPASPGLLYAAILARGDPQHPVLRALPRPE